MRIRNAILILISALLMFGCSQLQFPQRATVAPTEQTIDSEGNPLPTKTKWVFYTSTPLVTDTPEPVIPTYAPVSGWQNITGDGFEIWLPGSYVGGNMETDLQKIVSNIRNLGGNYKWIADTIEQNPEMYVVYATDSKVGPSGFTTNINIGTEPILSTFSIDAYMSSASAGLPEEFQITSKKVLTLNGYDAGQMIIEFEINGVKGKELFYIFKGESKAWTITLATGADEYDARLLEFVQIADSFRIESE